MIQIRKEKEGILLEKSEIHDIGEFTRKIQWSGHQIGLEANLSSWTSHGRNLKTRSHFFALSVILNRQRLHLLAKYRPRRDEYRRLSVFPFSSPFFLTPSTFLFRWAENDKWMATGPVCLLSQFCQGLRLSDLRELPTAAVALSFFSSLVQLRRRLCGKELLKGVFFLLGL
ncbi:hypothetical protein CEXT_674541 [Caerostris extrusa]|uniref:Uncharacterized protein n=1 Tax=Caerostris extrusa TaxID=172846 RepID=A0AAV4S855_CAEEX|nr:hypothetical protein CEXT_674541 [Caerostris extrusa]